MKLFPFVLICSFAFSIAACNQVPNNKSPMATPKLRDAVTKKKLYHGEMETVASPAAINGIIAQALKDRKLSVDESKTIGEAFDSYEFAAKHEWRETHTRVDPYFVDCIYQFPVHPLSLLSFREKIVARKLEVKFAVYEDGTSYVSLVSRIDTKTDGMIHSHHYSPVEMKNIVTAIYENREIVF